MKSKIIILFVLLVVIAGGVLGGIKLHRIRLRDQPGILLAFDDYSEDNWESHFDLFDKYDAKVTFFINAACPTEFCEAARTRGHEIGYHTIGHANLTEMTEEEVYKQAIAPIEVFREGGFELTSFAYPYGAYNEELNDLLLQHYNVVRGAYRYDPHIKHDLRKGFVESMSLDNINYESQEQFEEQLTELLTAMSESKGTVASFYSHTIDGGNWCVSEDKLEFLLKKAKELGLKFYTFQELQKD